MSSMTRPRGRLPARVYWVRRGVVLAVVFLLVFTVTRIFSGGSDEKATAEQASGQPSGQTEGETDAEGDGVEKQGATKKKKKPKKTLAAPDGPCDPTEVTVTAEVKKQPAGSDVIKLPLELTTDREACTFVVSQRTVALKVTSGKDLIWSSQHCGKVLGSHDVIVRRAEPATVTIQWNGRRSSAGCVLGNWAMPGGYHAIAATLGGEPTDQYFELTDAEPEVITKTKKNKKKKKSGDADETGQNETAQKKKKQQQKKKNQQNGNNGGGNGNGNSDPSDDASAPTEERANGSGAQEP